MISSERESESALATLKVSEVALLIEDQEARTSLRHFLL